jgi:hypothetical protein
VKKILLAAALLATPAHAQVHYPIITVTGNVTIIDTGIHETFAGVTYDERLYIITGFGAPNTQSESAEWLPIASPPPIIPPPPPIIPPPPVVCTDCNPPPCTDCGPPPPCTDCNPPPPCLTCEPPPVGPGTPEESTWVMMLLGFVGLGYAARRRKRLA